MYMNAAAGNSSSFHRFSDPRRLSTPSGLFLWISRPPCQALSPYLGASQPSPTVSGWPL